MASPDLHLMAAAAAGTLAVILSALTARSRRSRSHAAMAAAAVSAAGAFLCGAWKHGSFAACFLLMFSACLGAFVLWCSRPPRPRILAAQSLFVLGGCAIQLIWITTPWACFGTLALLACVFLGLLRLQPHHRSIAPLRLLVYLLPVLWTAYAFDLFLYRGSASPVGDIAVLVLLFAVGLNVLLNEGAQTTALVREVLLKQRRWASLLRSMKLPVVACDSDGHIEYVNPCCAENLGYSLLELRGKRFDAWIGKSNLNDPLARDAAGSPSGWQIRMTTKTGELRRIVWSRVPVSGSAGGAGFAFIGEDVTRIEFAEGQRDHALEQLRQANARMETESVCLAEEAKPAPGSTCILGESDAIRYVLRKVDQVAPTDATVLIEGETGVGKELVARAIHHASARTRGPFVPVNCAALPPTLVESELFGHERGAFTGADRQRKGRFEAAEGGTLFLDEVGELPLDMQGKLLRVLQEGEFERVGSSVTRKSNARVIAATNRNLPQEIKAGRFREDLFYRLQVYPISVPALRERREDIPLLIAHFVRQLAAKYGKQIDTIPGHWIAHVQDREWPGNVRELMNVVERAVIMSEGHKLAVPPELVPSVDVCLNIHAVEGLMSLACAERNHILKVLEHTSGRIAGRGGAAEVLEMHPNTLRARMDKLGILKKEDRRALSLPARDIKPALPVRTAAGLQAL